jgi:hypothetical protein
MNMSGNGDGRHRACPLDRARYYLESPPLRLGSQPAASVSNQIHHGEVRTRYPN